MAWDDDLEGAAWDIAASQAKRLRVMAGPGTGKSYALKRRVTRLLEEGHDPRRILVVTFTRTAAASLVDDLANLGVPGCDKIRASTLHSYCFGLLSREEVFQYLGRTPRPLITFEKSRALQFEGRMLTHDLAAADGRFSKTRDTTKRIRRFAAAWAYLQTDEPGWASDPADRDFESLLRSWLRFHNAMLIDELMPETLRFLRGNPASEVLNSFDHVIVDEYQDLNRAEQEIIDLLAAQGNTMIVGDVDQSIYGFRYANPDGIIDYGNRHRSTHDETLQYCYRCPTRVVSIADRLIRNNHGPNAVTRLHPAAENEAGDISLVQWNHPIAEAQGLAAYVSHLIAEQGYQPSDILILMPRRKLAYDLRNLLRGREIPAHSFYREEALEEVAAQRAFALLALLANPSDRVALHWWLGHKSPGNSLSKSYAKLRAHCETTDAEPWQALVDLTENRIKVPGTKPLLGPFAKLRAELESCQTLSPREVVDRLLPEDDEDRAVLRDFAELVVADCEEVGDLYPQLRTHLIQPGEPEGEFVRIMSLQKAKGLTSRVVIVSACIEGLIPMIDDDETEEKQEQSIQEQRRLFYVAITRCTDALVISSVAEMQPSQARNIGAKLRNVRRGFGKAITSRYVHELGPTAPRMMQGRDWQASGFKSG